MRKILGILVSFVLFSQLFAQTEKIRGTNTVYDRDDWITISNTRFINHLAAGQEFVFFATTGGITRYNFFTKSWDTPWTMSDGLASNVIELVAPNLETGYLFCVTDVGISFQEPATKYWKNIFYDESSIPFDTRITSIGFESGKPPYLYTNSGELYELDTFSEQIQFVNRLPKSRQKNIEWFQNNNSNEQPLPQFFMENGFIFDQFQKTIDDFQLRKFDITCWFTDAYQNVWMGTWGMGAVHGYIPSGWAEPLIFGLWDETVDAITKDDDNYLIGGIANHDLDSGITALRDYETVPTFVEPYLINGFDNDRITSIAADENFIFYGTETGLTVYNKFRDSYKTLTNNDHLSGEYIYDLVSTPNSVWVATERGISLVEKSTIGVSSFDIHHINPRDLSSTRVFDLEMSKNLLWAATDNGIYIYDTLTKKGGFYKGGLGPANREVYAVSAFGDEVWFGTQDGVEAYNTFTKEWLTPPAQWLDSNLEINKILALRTSVWITTEEGVYKFDREANRWVHFTMQDGLPSNHVYAVYPDGDYIWFGTDNGLTRFYWNSPYRID